MAAHHEKESDDLASLKATHNLHWKGWESADMETHFSTVHPEGSGVFPNGDLASDMKNLDYDGHRNSAKRWYENFEVQMDNLNFKIRFLLVLICTRVTIARVSAAV